MPFAPAGAVPGGIVQLPRHPVYRVPAGVNEVNSLLIERPVKVWHGARSKFSHWQRAFYADSHVEEASFMVAITNFGSSSLADDQKTNVGRIFC